MIFLLLFTVNFVVVVVVATRNNGQVLARPITKRAVVEDQGSITESVNIAQVAVDAGAERDSRLYTESNYNTKSIFDLMSHSQS